MSQARSLWRLELARTKWSGGFINWYHPMRIRHLTTGRCKFSYFLKKKKLINFFNRSGCK